TADGKSYIRLELLGGGSVDMELALNVGSAESLSGIENDLFLVLLTDEEIETVGVMRRAFNSMKADEAVDRVIDLYAHTKNNREFCQMMKKMRIL
ncbi:MAG: hypothetical protein ILN61_07305, partial [Lachnospiraceae bacterium]|nr:hypothetical protein [Lachnospiraceae bacterium]